MIEVVVSYGTSEDSAEADTPAAARLAARTLMRDAREHGAGDPRAAFYVDGVLVVGDLKRSEVQ